MNTRFFSCKRAVLFVLVIVLPFLNAHAQGQTDTAGRYQADLSWFEKARFGLFIHWGLYSQLAGQWKGHDYFGSGEWIMNRAKIPAGEYAQVAASFNPVDFNAEQWAQIAKRSGVRYLVITAKHHEGFSMFDSKVTHFDIVEASPYGKDPMKALSAACRKEGIQFGFYYSQFLDWHEPNGGGNTWDFKKDDKDYQKYYREKAIPQLEELLTDYGPLGIVWFDMPGGLTTAQTAQLVNDLHRLQPQCLFSSRVGHDLGDYRDFGDSEVPEVPIKEAWEAIFTANDSWGYIAKDKNFKSSGEIIRLLANVASKGGNLMLNVGPDGKGRFPPYEVECLLKTGQWLQRYGESIYGTTYGLIPPQPWGVTTSKPGKLYLHIFRAPANRKLYVPFIKAAVKQVMLPGTGKVLRWTKERDGLLIDLPEVLPDDRDAVVELDYEGDQPDHAADHLQTVGRQYPEIKIPVVQGDYHGRAANRSVTSSHYFGDWKHDNCAAGMKDTADAITFDLDIRKPGNYRIILDYACSHASSGREGIVQLADQKLYFRSLETGEYDSHKPLLFIQHAVGLITIPEKGHYKLSVGPSEAGAQELCWLRNVIVQPVQ